MLKPTVKRGLMLDFIPNEIICPNVVNRNRVFSFNRDDFESRIYQSDEIIYVMRRELRIEDNWGFIFASEVAEKYDKKFKVIINLNDKYYSKHQLGFILNGLNFLKKNLALNNINFEISEKIPKTANALIYDFNPIRPVRPTQNSIYLEVDSHNIIPARIVSNKQEFSAATLRRKIYANIAEFLTEYPNKFRIINGEAKGVLEDFINNKLEYYAEYKNNPNMDITSGFSPYLHFGLLSSQRIALEVIKSNNSRENKEAFLEELIVRKELADNFCLYGNSYTSMKGIPTWAKESLNAHRLDIRNYNYTKEEFELAKTHDALWNKIQENLLEKGKIHGYLRMYWAKKILEWSKTPEEALKTAIYLNDEYALDGNDPNGYVGILWCIGGLHDRAFTNRLVTGKIRYMSLQGCKSKFDINKYIKG